jgi:hypothetical protein
MEAIEDSRSQVAVYPVCPGIPKHMVLGAIRGGGCRVRIGVMSGS